MSSRTYGGETAQDRASRRRRQLLDAGLELFGTVGYRHASVRALCREAQLTDRYFYQHFAKTEDLLIAVYDECVDRLTEATTSAVGETDGGVREMARAGLDAFLGIVEDDPRLARVVWVEVLGVSPRVAAHNLERMRAFGQLLVTLHDERTTPVTPSVEQRILADAAVGGVSHAVLNWSMSGFYAPRGQMVEMLAEFLEATASVGRQ